MVPFLKIKDHEARPPFTGSSAPDTKEARLLDSHTTDCAISRGSDILRKAVVSTVRFNFSASSSAVLGFKPLLIGVSTAL